MINFRILFLQIISLKKNKKFFLIKNIISLIAGQSGSREVINYQEFLVLLMYLKNNFKYYNNNRNNSFKSHLNFKQNNNHPIKRRTQIRIKINLILFMNKRRVQQFKINKTKINNNYLSIKALIIYFRIIHVSLVIFKNFNVFIILIKIKITVIIKKTIYFYK